MAASILDPCHPSDDGNSYKSDEFYDDMVIDAVSKGEDCVQKAPIYPEKLASHLNQLREEGSLCDITIVVNQRRFPAHKVVLCAASNYFSVMFNGVFQEASQSEVKIDGNCEAFERLLEFAYTGEIKLNMELIGDIISMASYLQLSKVARPCSYFLMAAYHMEVISLHDAYQICNMCTACDFSSLKSHAERYLAKHFVEFSKTETFLKDASPEHVESMLNRVDLAVWATEEQILTAVTAWLKQNWECRKQYAKQFLGLIRLGLVPMTTLKQIADVDLQGIPECKEMAEEVEKCLVSKEMNKTALETQFPHFFASRGIITTVIEVTEIGHTRVQCFHRNKWRSLETFAIVPVLQSLNHYQVIVADGELYLAGGCNKRDSFYEFPDKSESSEFSDFEHFFKYDRSSNVWNQWPSMKRGRSRFSMISYDGFIYAIGGKVDLDNTRFHQNVERFNLATRVWEEVASLPVAIGHISCVAYQKVILIYGIHEVELTDAVRKGSLYAFDPANQTWTFLATESLPINEELENDHDDAGNLNLNFPPVLAVDEDRCYRISYFGSEVPTVSNIIINLEHRQPSAMFSEPQNPRDQELVAKHNRKSGAFVINKWVFVNVNGCVHKLDLHLDCGKVADCQAGSSSTGTARPFDGRELKSWYNSFWNRALFPAVVFTFDICKLMPIE